jgi:phospholipid/cholesterol/gamma-HCH transport system substrate-binding protein
MSSNHQSQAVALRFRVGLFTLLGLSLVAAITVYVNDRPYWWRPCHLVHISVEDATGLKPRSPIRSLGIEIGFLKYVELSETKVRLGICITAPIEVLSATRAYLRSDGFLGDKFVELKPVRYLNKGDVAPQIPQTLPSAEPVPGTKAAPKAGRQLRGEDEYGQPLELSFRERLMREFTLVNVAIAAEDIPVGKKDQDMDHLVKQVDSLVEEMHGLTGNLKEAIDPKELKSTMSRLNKTLENASKTLSPEGGLNSTAQRTLAKLEDGIEQLRDLLTRMNRGEGSIGMLVNDPKYANQIAEAVESINKLLGKVRKFEFYVNLGAEFHPAYTSGRGWLNLSIWPDLDRYYLLGVSFDPRGKRTLTSTTTVTKTTDGNGAVSTETKTIEENKVESSMAVVTAMLGKVLWERVNLSAGALHGDGTVAAALWWGPEKFERSFETEVNIYAPGVGQPVNLRLELQAQPWYQKRTLLNSAYVRVGIDSIRQVNSKLAWFMGAGVSFSDEDVRLLFTLY